MKIALNKPDSIGALSSLLCLLHCMATPFLFIAQSSAMAYEETSHGWWGFIDYFFLVISFIAIYRSAKTSSSNTIKNALWVSWFLLVFVIVNETKQFVNLPEYTIYIPALLLIVLHIYHLKYCQCQDDKCCSKHQLKV